MVFFKWLKSKAPKRSRYPWSSGKSRSSPGAWRTHTVTWGKHHANTLLGYWLPALSYPGSVILLFDGCPGHHSRGPSPVESPNLQSPAATAGLPDHRQHHGVPGEKPAALSSFSPPSLSISRWRNGGSQCLERNSTWTTTLLSSLLVVKFRFGPEVHKT